MVWTSSLNQVQDNYTEGALRQDLEGGLVTGAVIGQNPETPTGSVTVSLSDGRSRTAYVTDVEDAIALLGQYEIDPLVRDVPQESWFMNYMLPVLVMAAVIMIFFFMMMNAQNAGAGAGGNKMMNFGKSRARMSTGKDNRITLKDVAGLKEEKEDLEEIIDFLREPSKYTKVGARIPKGVLLEGPPGTGKTLLAKAIAGEANVPFFSISGSDFVEMFVGVGASRVRDLFEDAKKNSPCIVFIDEIDAVARRRGTGMGGGHDEREQTLNQLLVEMDGFGVNEGIIVLAATNRVDILDPAILRPGRFDRKIAVGTPDVGGREDILKLHARNKPLAEDVDLKQVAQTTAGFTGADLENLLNEAAILAAGANRAYVSQEDIRKAFVKVGIGTEKKSRIITDKEKKITAFHEAGHAILFHVLPDVGPVYTVSIIPTGSGAAGYTMPLPERDEMFLTRGRMEQEIMVSLGGRIAEQLIFDDITTGASSDIKKATKMARMMVARFGMSENIGVVCYDDDDDEVFIGRDLAHARAHSEMISGEIDKEVKRIIDSCYERATELIRENMEALHKCAELLLKKERINRAEFEALFEDEKPFFENV
ncbi:MAG TPA: ATP-dependent zinc metalloprotease FtsH [Candidatus Eisenbergiella pullistercoris]|uniref:ATP-dependent zinc metalloprotease FtsH n=1 Tax=Candidatus Eisenbergiella pullistercoris TaxID=2838555 RepID=A0A9D2C7A2_9FIRM|nr:ATP-dependent zinc metalloprotease FtsH [Candidatus Eisenbergiella pullistercoris]